MSNPKKHRILIVEDDKFWSKKFSSLLKGLFLCKVVTNYVDAIKILERSSPKVLILDLKLGDSSYHEDGWGGWQLTEVAKNKGISCIVVTGYPKFTRASRAFREFDVIDFFPKQDFPEVQTVFVQRVLEAADKSKKQRINYKINSNKESNNEKVVFISYSHKDRKWLSKFTTNLKVLSNNHRINIWDDTNIRIGNKWRDEIINALAKASVAILLVTSDFLASDFINKEELPVIFREAQKRGLQIVWVAVKPSLYEETYISEVQSANDPSRPLSSLTKAKADEEIVQICKKVKELVN